MRTLSIDIETYSDVDIGACGAYKYVDSPNFEILLFAYSFDFEPAKVIDLMDYEEIPEEVVDALFDPEVVKRAYNAPFERTCLAKHFGRPMPPEQWRCDMVLGAVCGLPLGLAAVSDALGLREDKRPHPLLLHNVQTDQEQRLQNEESTRTRSGEVGAVQSLQRQRCRLRERDHQDADEI